MKKLIPMLILLLTLGSTYLFAQQAQSTSEIAANKKNDRDKRGEARRFVGYWMGIDPLDGGDSRRGITQNEDGSFSVIGRDTVFTLCDNTDRAIVLVDDAVLDRSRLISDNLVIRCFNTGAIVHLKVRYVVIDTNIIRETTTQQNGDPVDQIIFHRVNQR